MRLLPGRVGILSRLRCYNNLLQVTGMRFGVGTTSGCGCQAGDPLGLRLEYTSGSQAQNNGNVMQQFIRMRKSAFDPQEIRFRQDYAYDRWNRVSGRTYVKGSAE